MKDYDNDKLLRAKKRVNEIKGFYIHLAIYIAVNAFILVNIYMHIDEGESFWQWGHFFTLFFWGTGVLGHAAGAFQYNPFLGKNWEERKIKELMDKDREEANKWK